MKLFSNVRSEDILSHANSVAVFSNDLQTSKMNFIRTIIVKRISKMNNKSVKVDLDGIHRFSRKMDRAFNPFLYIS